MTIMNSLRPASIMTLRRVVEAKMLQADHDLPIWEKLNMPNRPQARQLRLNQHYGHKALATLEAR